MHVWYVLWATAWIFRSGDNFMWSALCCKHFNSLSHLINKLRLEQEVPIYSQKSRPPSPSPCPDTHIQIQVLKDINGGSPLHLCTFCDLLFEQLSYPNMTSRKSFALSSSLYATSNLASHYWMFFPRDLRWKWFKRDKTWKKNTCSHSHSGGLGKIEDTLHAIFSYSLGFFYSCVFSLCLLTSRQLGHSAFIISLSWGQVT